MQHSSAASPDCDQFTPAQTPNGQGHVVQDTGLGITTSDNIFIGAYHSLNSGQEQLAFVKHEDTERIPPHGSSHERKLSSPFDERYYTPGPQWTAGYPPGSLSEGVPSTYSFTADQSVLLAPESSIPSHYTNSPLSYCNVPVDYGNLQRFHRPYPRHHSMASSMAQQPVYHYQTPGIDASPFQWTPQSDNTPQSETPGWQDANQNVHGHLQLPTNPYQYYSRYNTAVKTPEIHRPQPVRAIMTAPSRRKPRLRPSLSESCVYRVPSPARARAASAVYRLYDHSHEQHADSAPVQQLPLPHLPPSVLINTPRPTEQNSVRPVTVTTSTQPRRANSYTNQRRTWSTTRPSSPPPEDFGHRIVPYFTPVRQDPTFEGDLYTPRYKRRKADGKWEGWCGYCDKWLDLKNSRYWEDKMRNHGICAKTKVKFHEPEQIRWVNVDGEVVPDIQGSSEVDGGNTFVDPQNRREGLCGVCHNWVFMDGVRTKARGRPVGWWTHAYKCHDHDLTLNQRSTPTSP